MPSVEVGVRDALAAVRGQLGLAGVLLAIAGLAWWWTARSMSGMDGGRAPIWARSGGSSGYG